MVFRGVFRFIGLTDEVEFKLVLPVSKHKRNELIPIVDALISMVVMCMDTAWIWKSHVV